MPSGHGHSHSHHDHGHSHGHHDHDVHDVHDACSSGDSHAEGRMGRRNSLEVTMPYYNEKVEAGDDPLSIVTGSGVDPPARQPTFDAMGVIKWLYLKCAACDVDYRKFDGLEPPPPKPECSIGYHHNCYEHGGFVACPRCRKELEFAGDCSHFDYLDSTCGNCDANVRVRKPKAKRWKRSDVALELRRAAECGDVSRIDSIISGSEHGLAVINLAGGLDPDVNAGEPNYTPLHWAAVRGHVETVVFLLHQGCDVNCTKNVDNGWTALHLAALMGHLEVVQMLVNHGGELNVFDEQGISPGYFAATRNNYEMLAWMIEYGWDMTGKGPRGWTAAHITSFDGAIKCLELIVKNGGNLLLPDDDGNCPLHLATREGHLLAVKYICELLGGEMLIRVLSERNAAGERAVDIARRLSKHTGRGKHAASDCETEGSACTANIGCILRYLEELVCILAEGRASVKAELSAAGRSGRRSRSPRGSGRNTPTSPRPSTPPSTLDGSADRSGLPSVLRELGCYQVPTPLDPTYTPPPQKATTATQCDGPDQEDHNKWAIEEYEMLHEIFCTLADKLFHSGGRYPGDAAHMQALADLDAERAALLRQCMEVRRMGDERKGECDTLRKRLIRMQMHDGLAGDVQPAKAPRSRVAWRPNGVSDYYERNPNPEWCAPQDYSLGQFGKGSWRPGQDVGGKATRKPWKPPGKTLLATDVPMVPSGEIVGNATGPLGGGTLPGNVTSNGKIMSAVYKRSDGASAEHGNHYSSTMHMMLADGRNPNLPKD